MLTQSRVIACGNILLLALILATPASCLAQVVEETAAGEANWSESLAAWASAGLGPGKIDVPNGNGITAVVRATASVGPWLATYRSGDIGAFISAGSGVRDSGVLAGMRTGGHRVFASAALGYARATPYHQSDGGSRYPTYAPSVAALAYELTLHANAFVPGLALSLFGDLGPAESSYSAFTMSVELGWFGR
ncbi:MAG: hypothetical protein M3Z05_05630 [Gemmatimonadota bacterium]|nr:hypothetical protein [Gemmatimonadota bacterium]